MMAGQGDSTERFSDRVEYYTKYRPGYPKAVIDFMMIETGLTTESIVADIGSGTGILTKLFLDFGCRVFAVEPNGPMRAEAERRLSLNQRFSSVAGQAEATTLSEKSINLIVAGQSFHWFDPLEARKEFFRILVPTGAVVLIWNERQIAGSGFMQAYEELLLTFGSDYRKVRHQDIGPEALGTFFGPGGFSKASFENFQELDFDGLAGRLYSSSYAPMEGHPDHDALQASLWNIFDRYQDEGRVRFEYKTQVYLGTLTGVFS